MARHVASDLLAAAERRPEHPALTVDGEAVDYATLVRRATNLARYISVLGRRSRSAPLTGRPVVALHMGNRPECAVSVLAVALAGGAAAMLDPKWPDATLSTALERLAPDLVIADCAVGAFGSVPALTIEALAEIADHGGADPLPPPDPRAPFLIGFTSGTTGRPKAFVRDHRSWVASFAASAAEFGTDARDTVVAPGPMVHSLTLYHMLEAWSVGATVCCLSAFDAAAAVATVRTRAATVLIGVPTMLFSIVEHLEASNERMPGLRLVMTAGSKLPPQQGARLADRCPNARIVEYYGASELSFVAQRSLGDGAPPDSVGRPFRDVEVAILDDDGRSLPTGATGLLGIRSAMISQGYLSAVADSDVDAGFHVRDGWATVGDVARLDEQGFIHLVGRRGGMIITGGLNVFPAEVEAVLAALPDVAEVAVFGLPDERWGEIVCAAIRWSAGAPVPTAEAIAAACEARLPRYKVPRRISRVDAMPMTGSGKIALKALEGAVAQGASWLHALEA